MSHFTWITCLWPGLSRLWLRGQWTGLGWAAAFGVWLNLILTFQFVWTSSIPAYGIELLWSCTGVIVFIGMLDGIFTTKSHRQQYNQRRMNGRDYTDRSPTQTNRNADGQSKPDFDSQVKQTRQAVLAREGEDMPPAKPTDALFIKARNQYLKGNWFESESLIEQILNEFPNDLEAQLIKAQDQEGYSHTANERH